LERKKKYTPFPFYVEFLFQGNYTFRDLRFQDGDVPPVLPAAELKVKVTWIATKTLILNYFIEVKVVKKGANEAQASGGAISGIRNVDGCLRRGGKGGFQSYSAYAH